MLQRANKQRSSSFEDATADAAMTAAGAEPSFDLGDLN